MDTPDVTSPDPIVLPDGTIMSPFITRRPTPPDEPLPPIRVLSVLVPPPDSRWVDVNIEIGSRKSDGEAAHG